jgi:DNA-3-methyladenine glycosylase
VDASFFDRDPARVAKELLGSILVRKAGDFLYRGRIVETEAYYGENDPASRAKHGKKIYNAPMFEGAGNIFVYNVHKYWMLNFSTKPVSAVLIRAVEPLNFEANTRGPGRLTVALKVDKSLTGLPIGRAAGIWVEKGPAPGKVARSFRIGVTKDLSTPLRFFDLESGWVSATRRSVSAKGFTK